MFHQLIYSSRFSREGGASSTLRDIVARSEAQNGRDRITGYLVFDKLHFIQVLEGAREDVERTFNRICQDDRHEAIAVIAKRDIDQRQFPEWSMGGCVRSDELKAIFNAHPVNWEAPSQSDPDDIIHLCQDVSALELERRKSRGLSGV